MNVLAVFFSCTEDPHGGCVQQLGVAMNETLDELSDLSDLRGIFSVRRCCAHWSDPQAGLSCWPTRVLQRNYLFAVFPVRGGHGL